MQDSRDTQSGSTIGRMHSKRALLLYDGNYEYSCHHRSAAYCMALEMLMDWSIGIPGQATILTVAVYSSRHQCC